MLFFSYYNECSPLLGFIPKVILGQVFLLSSAAPNVDGLSLFQDLIVFAIMLGPISLLIFLQCNTEGNDTGANNSQ